MNTGFESRQKGRCHRIIGREDVMQTLRDAAWLAEEREFDLAMA